MKITQLFVLAAFLGQDADAVQLEHHHHHKHHHRHHPKHHHGHPKNLGVRFLQTMKEENSEGMTEPEPVDLAKTGELGKVDTPEEAKELAKSIKEREEAPMVLPAELSEEDQKVEDTKMFDKLATEGERLGRKKQKAAVEKDLAIAVKEQTAKVEKAKADMEDAPPPSVKVARLAEQKKGIDAVVAADKNEETAESVEKDEADKKDRIAAAELADDKKQLDNFKKKKIAEDEAASAKIEAAAGPKPVVADPTAAKLADANAKIAKIIAADEKAEEIKAAEDEVRKAEVKPDNVGQAASAGGEAEFDGKKEEAKEKQEEIDEKKGKEEVKKVEAKAISKEVAKEGVKKDVKLIPGYSKAEHWTVNMPDHIQAGGSLMQLDDDLDSDSDSE